MSETMCTPNTESRHLDSIQINQDSGGVLLAASSLTGRLWTGALYYYNKPTDAPDTSKAQADAQLEAGIADAKWVQGTRLVAGSDSGTMMVWDVQQETSEFHCLSNSSEHDGVIHSVSVNASKEKAVSAGQDRVVKVWDLEAGISVHTYKGHCDSVLCATYHPNKQDLFISCSRAGNIVLWDLRKSKPASVIDTLSSKSILPSCLEWLPDNSHRVAIGTESGELIVQDLMSPSKFQVKEKVHKRPVHRLALSPHRKEWLATASEDCTAAVFDISGSSIQSLTRISGHSDFVQGVCWSGSNAVVTCGWDGKVICSDVQPAVTNGEESMDVNSPDASKPEAA